MLTGILLLSLRFGQHSHDGGHSTQRNVELLTGVLALSGTHQPP